MKAIEITQFGTPEVLQLCERDIPTPKPGEVLIKVHAAGINRPDVLQRLGKYPVPAGVSDLPGLEVAGEITQGDLKDSPFKLGDMVCALVQGGGYSQYCTAPIKQCLPIPQGLTMIEAASLPETFFTVWSNLFHNTNLHEIKSILIHGGTSGIGVTASQIAHAFGHRVFTTVGSDEKCRASISLGAAHAINYNTHDFVAVIKEHTNNQGVDIILDMIAGDYLSREIHCLANDGKIAVIALQGGTHAQLDLRPILTRRLHITGSALRPRSVDFKHTIACELQTHVWPLLEAKKIKPVIYKIFNLEDAAQAHALMQTNTHIGKIVLQVQ